jgi:hypothetical protein
MRWRCGLQRVVSPRRILLFQVFVGISDGILQHRRSAIRMLICNMVNNLREMNCVDRVRSVLWHRGNS